MKKVILLVILFISLIGNVNAQDSTKVELTKETIYKDVKHALTQLGDALKVGAEHVYGILVKQQVANSIINIALYISLIILIIIGYHTTRNTFRGHIALYQLRHGRNGQPDLNCYPDLDDTAKGATALVLGIMTTALFIAFVIAFCATISQTITGFVNPEYGAIKEIMELIK